MYIKEFEIRWNDVDANRHLANAAYINFMSHARVSFLKDHKVSLNLLAEYNIGPVIFNERIFYFKESHLSETVKVSVEVSGLSEDTMLFEFRHNFYNTEGKNLAHGSIIGGWLDLEKRKLTTIPNDLIANYNNLSKSEDFRILTRHDMRRDGIKPKDLNI